MTNYDVDDSDGVTELTFIDPSRVDGVMTPATGSSFLVLKSRAAGPRLSPEARAAFRENAARVKRGEQPKRGKTVKQPKGKKGNKRRRGAGPLLALKAASSYGAEIPATGVPNEAASILAAVTGEHTNRLCNARTSFGMPCRRPATRTGRCHLHG